MIGLLPGDYKVSIKAQGFATQYYKRTDNASKATPVSVFMGIDTPGIDFNLEEGGKIAGHVYESDGHSPICGAIISVSYQGITKATTSADGSYTLKGLPSGNFQVFVNAYGHIREFYESALYAEEASPVSVTAPGTT